MRAFEVSRAWPAVTRHAFQLERGFNDPLH